MLHVRTEYVVYHSISTVLVGWRGGWSATHTSRVVTGPVDIGARFPIFRPPYEHLDPSHQVQRKLEHVHVGHASQGTIILQ